MSGISTSVSESARDEITVQIGASSATTNAAAMVAGRVSNARQDRANAATSTGIVAQINSQTREEFKDALAQCLSSFTDFAKKLGLDIDAYLQSAASALNMPTLKKQFEALNPLAKSLLVVALLGLLALLHFLTWESIQYLWGQLMEFINSETGQQILATCTDVLTFINTSGLVGSFGVLLNQAVEIYAKEGEDMDTDVTPQLDVSLETLKMRTPLLAIVTLLTTLFSFLKQKATVN